VVIDSSVVCIKFYGNMFSFNCFFFPKKDYLPSKVLAEYFYNWSFF